jgi:thiosulfate/3-mercaptopyruvate sulfurtransferase
MINNSPIINTVELLAINTNTQTIIIEASNMPDAKSIFDQEHLLGAIYIDVNTEMADIKEDVSIGGRHPLPSVDSFINLLAGKGITSQHHIVIYDRKNGANAAARLWWMLKAIGHEQVQVLNGGYQEALKQGYPTSQISMQLRPTEISYNLTDWLLPVVNIAYIDEAICNNDNIIIDVRESYRYNGESEPIDLIAGHIPTAVNQPFLSNLNEDGLFRSPEELNKIYGSYFSSGKKIAVHCGSGITACHTLLAMCYAGFDIPSLYVGSWSEWSRNRV